MREDFSLFKKSIEDKRVAVLGIGVSNRPLIRYISNIGAKVTACDRKAREQLGSICSEFEDMGVELKLGPDYLDDISNFDIIFKTPSLRPDLPQLIAAREKGAYITSEMEEFMKYCKGNVIGVTGSDGKTTTTSLIYNMLKEEGYRVWLGGNIGTPLFDKLDEIMSEDKVVLELSSFQLMTMSVSPDIAVVTNLSPNHLDIHKSMDEYLEAKKNIFKHQGKNNLLVLNFDNEITRKMGEEAKGEVCYFSRLYALKHGSYLKGEELVLTGSEDKRVCTLSEIKLPGNHNVENLLAAITAARRWCSIESMRKVAISFAGVEHRIEFVREVCGIKFYNDSIASSPTRAIAALNSFNQKVILIAGGYDKKIPFDELAEVGIKKVKLLILIGVTAEKIAHAFKEAMTKFNAEVPIAYASSFEDAVEKAMENGKPGDIVTLSPACASFDMFTNFEERGNRFKEIVNSI